MGWTGDMPTVDGARAEAERQRMKRALAGSRVWLNQADAHDAGFVAGAEWLAPTVAALEAEVERLRAEAEPAQCVMTHTEPFDFAQCETHDETFPLGGVCRFNGREAWEVYADEADEQRQRAVMAEIDRDAERAHADAAEAVIGRVWGIVTDWGAGTVHRPRSPYYGRLLAALLDAAPQAVDSLRVTVAGRRSGTTSAMAQAIVNDARERGVPVEVVDGPEVVETEPKCGKPVGDRPSWMSPAQWAVDACNCIRVRGHEGECRCEHTDATDGREGAR